MIKGGCSICCTVPTLAVQTVACLLPQVACNYVWQQSTYVLVKAVMAGGLCGGVPGSGQGSADQPQ